MANFNSDSEDIFSQFSATDSPRMSFRDDERYDILSRVIRGRSVQFDIGEASTI